MVNSQYAPRIPKCLEIDEVMTISKKDVSGWVFRVLTEFKDIPLTECAIDFAQDRLAIYETCDNFKQIGCSEYTIIIPESLKTYVDELPDMALHAFAQTIQEYLTHAWQRAIK